MTLQERTRAGAVLRRLSVVFGALAVFVWTIPAARADAPAAPAAITLQKNGGAAPGRIEPLTTPGGLASPTEEKAVRLEKARVILADYPLIKHDFGSAIAARYNRPLETISNDEIDGWILDSAAYISEPQTKQTAVNTPIPPSTRSVKAFRPADYGRALVFQPAPGVLIDVKGSGAVDPQQGDHSNGLATLGEVIREYAYEHLIHKVFEHSGAPDRTVGHYAVIDTGFDVKQPDGRVDPAGLILRQAHSRATGDLSALSNKDTKRIEMTLRRYGITSAGAYQNEPFDALNLQGTKDGAVLDFGGFLVMPKFEKPAYHFDRTPEVSPRYKPLLSQQKDFVQPDDAIRVPNELWGYTVSQRADPIADNPTRWSHELATSLRQGRATRKDAEQHMHNLLDPVDARLKAHPVPPPIVTAKAQAPTAATRRASSTTAVTKPGGTVPVAPAAHAPAPVHASVPTPAGHAQIH
jgi:hypothetical protein